MLGEGMLGKCWLGVRNVCWLFAGLGMGVAGMGLIVLERARGGRCAGVCSARCGAMRRSRGGGDARACRGQGAGVICDGAADFWCRGGKYG